MARGFLSSSREAAKIENVGNLKGRFHLVSLSVLWAGWDKQTSLGVDREAKGGISLLKTPAR